MEKSTSYTLEELAKITSSEVVGDPSYRVYGVESLESATEKEVSFLANPLYLKVLKRSNVGAVFVNQPPEVDLKTNYLLNPNPSKAFQQVIELFHDHSLANSAFTGVHPTAVIHPSAQIADNVEIGPYTIIDQKVHIGPNTQIGAHVSIGPHVKIGSHCTIHPSVTIRENCELQDYVIIQPGAVIGSCGFGYITDAKGNHNKLLHVGRVVIEDHVEIGSNTTIDRARFKETRIHSGVKIDNQVQVGHGVHIGANSIIISQVGIAGSTILGKYNVIAGQVGIVGHIKTCDHVTVAARGALTKDIKKPGQYGGAPALPQDKFYKQHMHLRNLDTYVKKIKEMAAKIKEFEKLVEEAGV